jgi:hypothetical protein
MSNHFGPLPQLCVPSLKTGFRSYDPKSNANNQIRYDPPFDFPIHFAPFWTLDGILRNAFPAIQAQQAGIFACRFFNLFASCLFGPPPLSSHPLLRFRRPFSKDEHFFGSHLDSYSVPKRGRLEHIPRNKGFSFAASREKDFLFFSQKKVVNPFFPIACPV